MMNVRVFPHFYLDTPLRGAKCVTFTNTWDVGHALVDGVCVFTTSLHTAHL